MRRIVSGGLGLVVFLIAGAAQAQSDCPRDPSALASGVTVRFDDMSITYRSTADGRLRETERYPADDETWVYVSLPTGLIFESWMEGPGGMPDDTTRESYSYVFIGGGYPAPMSGTNAIGRETAVLSDGSTEENLVAWTFGPEREVMIGACRYRAIPIYETRASADAPAAEAPSINRYLHLSELGFSMFLGGDVVGVEPQLSEPRAIALGETAP
jgi:hypothetical protein